MGSAQNGLVPSSSFPQPWCLPPLSQILGGGGAKWRKLGEATRKKLEGVFSRHFWKQFTAWILDDPPVVILATGDCSCVYFISCLGKGVGRFFIIMTPFQQPPQPHDQTKWRSQSRRFPLGQPLRRHPPSRKPRGKSSVDLPQMLPPGGSI